MMKEVIAVEGAKSLVQNMVKELVVPKMKEFAKHCKLKYNEIMISRGEHFGEYLSRAYDKYSIINTLVFHNSQRLLKDIYVAQKIVQENQVERRNKPTKISGFPIALIKKYKKILITDTAGMGKSTIMKRMFIDVIDNCMKDAGIPIYIELNRLNKEHRILDEISKELNSLSKEFDNDLLLRLIQTGGFVFFLDGYDEISITDRLEVTRDIQTFIYKAGLDNYYFLTSRPENGLTSFGDFQSFNIQPLTKKEAFALLNKYDINKKKELSGKLIEVLQSGLYDSIDEYLVNPLLVSLLFTAYDYNRSIPFEKHRFYGVVFEAYFEKHDSSKPIKPRDKFSGLNYDGFDRVLRYLGYDCLVKNRVKFNEDTILNAVRNAKIFCGNLDFSESLFLKDLISSVPLFCKEGTDYKWVHKSLMEYFAARFIFCDAKENQDKILSKIYNSNHLEKYINMLDLYYDIDFKGFNKNIRYPFCKKYISYYDSINNNNMKVSSELVKERISKLFICKPVFMKLGGETYLEFKKSFGANLIESSFFRKNFMVYEDPTNGFYFSSASIDSYNLFIVRFASSLARIWDLLYVHSKDLFNTSKHMVIMGEDVIKENIIESQIYKMDVNTGDCSNEMYELLNEWILFPSNRNNKITYSDYLNYDACKKVVDDYERTLKINNNSLDLFEEI